MTHEEFIEKIAAAVKKIGPKYGIDVVSPIVAQACLESGYGTSNKAKKNNFFGLKYRKNRVKCHNGKFTDTSSEQNPDGTYTKISTEWYSFATLEDGVEGYFQFIDTDNYKNLKGVTDPFTYLQNIKADGYATSHKYVENVTKVIKSNDLTRFDNTLTLAESTSKAFKVHIDPGHYGDKYNKTSTGLDYYESRMTWALSNYLKTELEKLGAEVTLSRYNINDDPSLYNRGYGAKGKDLFLSIHSNAASNETADYPLVIRGYKKKEADEFGLKMAKLIEELMGTKQKGKTWIRRADSDLDKNGELDDEWYGVMYGADMAGLTYYYIVEHSFHTNYNATKFLCSDDNLKLLAKKEAKLIADYFKIKKKEEPKKEESKEEQDSKYYRVRKTWSDSKSQIGAYNVLENAKKACKEGYSVYDWTGKKIYSKLTAEEVAKEVIAGKWGNGAARKKALEDAGYNYTEVQKIVNQMLKK